MFRRSPEPHPCDSGLCTLRISEGKLSKGVQESGLQCEDTIFSGSGEYLRVSTFVTKSLNLLITPIASWLILTLMIQLMDEIPEGSDIVFLTNAAYIQNFDREPGPKSANQDLILKCIESKKKQPSAVAKRQNRGDARC